jgi:uncharacterized protein with FMN-binding domain
MRRITFWLLSTVSVVVLLFGFDASGATTPTAALPPSATSSPTAGSGATSSGSATSGTTSSGANSSGSTTPSTKSSATATVTGDVASTQWGPVQVRLTVTGGKVTKVDVVHYPNGNPRDQEINSYALPILTQETLDQQNAQIDMVSGATVTSTGYVQSLQSALDKAGV